MLIPELLHSTDKLQTDGHTNRTHDWLTFGNLERIGICSIVMLFMFECNLVAVNESKMLALLFEQTIAMQSILLSMQ